MIWKSWMKYVALTVIGMLLAAIGGIMFPVVDHIVREEVKKKVIISTTSELYEIWQDIPVPVYMQFYLFNVINADEIKAGEKPLVAQRGPYTYRERREKYDIVWNSNGTVTYRQNRTFSFVPEMSAGNESDMILTINPVVAVVAQNYDLLSPTFQLAVSSALTLFSEELFTTRPVKELLWGYDDSFLEFMKSFMPTQFTTSNIGYFMGKAARCFLDSWHQETVILWSFRIRNYTDDGLYMVDTGEKEIDLLGTILSFNEKKNIDIWTTPWARMVNGSDGTIGPPFIFDKEIFQVFVSDICRSIKGVYREETETPQGISLRRYGGDPSDMSNATINPDNIGFCTPQEKCLPTGLLNGTLCEAPVDGFHIPVIFSFPHFLYGDPDVVNSVYGIKPNQKEHDTVIDVEPWTGLVLQASKRLQVNMFIEKVDGVSQTKNVRRLYFPIFWLNESSVVDDKHANMLQDQLFTPLLIIKIVEIVLLSIGGLLTLVGICLLIRARYSLTEEKPQADISNESSSSSSPMEKHVAISRFSASDIQSM